MFVEVAGGFLANSLALLSDALHMFTDVGALLLGIVVSKIAKRPTTPNMSYGYHRAEVIGALVSSAALWALSGVLVYESIVRLLHPEEVEGPIVFVIATIGLVANLLMMRTLHDSQHNINVRAAYLHVVGDLLGSIGVIISGVILWLTGFNPIDPIVTIVFTTAILFSSAKIIRQSLSVLMESTPEGIDPTAVGKTLASLEGVKEIHDLHIWTASTHGVVLSVHLVAKESPLLLSKAHQILEEVYGIRHMTIQIEDPAAFESRYCYDCENNI